MKSRNEKVDEKTAILLLKHGQYGLVCRNFDYFHIEDKSNFLKQTLKAGIRGKHSLHITKNLVTKNTEHYHTIVKTERRIEESITGIIRQLASTANKEEKECLREIFMNQGRMSICSKHTIDEIFGE